MGASALRRRYVDRHPVAFGADRAAVQRGKREELLRRLAENRRFMAAIGLVLLMDVIGTRGKGSSRCTRACARDLAQNACHPVHVIGTPIRPARGRHREADARLLRCGRASPHRITPSGAILHHDPRDQSSRSDEGGTHGQTRHPRQGCPAHKPGWRFRRSDGVVVALPVGTMAAAEWLAASTGAPSRSR